MPRPLSFPLQVERLILDQDGSAGVALGGREDVEGVFKEVVRGEE